MTLDQLVEVETASLRAFVMSAAGVFFGRTLDYGCGRQPYRDVVEQAGGEYVPWDRKALPGGAVADYGPERADRGEYDAILCTQVIQYVQNVDAMLKAMRRALKRGGALVLTGPTCWVEPPGHLHNLTCAGVRLALEDAGFAVERLEIRGRVGPGLSIGYGAVARA